MNLCLNSPSFRSDILYCNFNQDASLLTVGTPKGMVIFRVEPFEKLYEHYAGGIGIVELHYTSSLVALVGSGDEPTLSPRKLMLFNTKNNTSLRELNFITAILAVKWNKQRLVVVLETKILIYDLEKMEALQIIETDPNPLGVCAMSEQSFLAYPRSGKLNLFNAAQIKPIQTVEAHKGAVSIVAFSNDGRLFATASAKGTVIRVFQMPAESQRIDKPLFSFRRGTYPATITSLSFSHDNRLLAVSSNSGTVHIFKLETVAPTITSGFVSSYLPTIAKEMWEPGRAFAWIRLPTPPNGTIRSICAIRDNDRCVTVVTEEGIMYHYLLDPINGGLCSLIKREVSIRDHISADT